METNEEVYQKLKEEFGLLDISAWVVDGATPQQVYDELKKGLEQSRFVDNLDPETLKDYKIYRYERIIDQLSELGTWRVDQIDNMPKELFEIKRSIFELTELYDVVDHSELMEWLASRENKP